MNYDFLAGSDGTGDAVVMNITADRAALATSILVHSVDNVPAKFIGTWGTKLPNGFIDPATKREFRGHPASGHLVIDAMEPGSIDSGNVTNQVVVIRLSTGWHNRVAGFIQNATGFGTPETLLVSDIITTGAVLLDGVADPTFRYTLTAGDFSNSYFQTSFAHGLDYIPWVKGRVNGSFLPRLLSINKSYWGKPPSAWIVVDRVDADNIYISGGIADDDGATVLAATPLLKFEFYCSPKPGV